MFIHTLVEFQHSHFIKVGANIIKFKAGDLFAVNIITLHETI